MRSLVTVVEVVNIVYSMSCFGKVARKVCNYHYEIVGVSRIVIGYSFKKSILRLRPEYLVRFTADF